MAAAIINVVSMASCSSDDDVTEEKKSLVACGIYIVTDDLIDLYNIKITAIDANGGTLQSFNLNSRQPDLNEDGLTGHKLLVDAKSAPITFKAEVTCRKQLSDLIDDKSYDLSYGTGCATGDSAEKATRSARSNTSIGGATASGSKMKANYKDTDITRYEQNANDFTSLMTIRTR